MIKLDNLHYSFREIDGYNKPFNFIMSARELGKTSMCWFLKVYCGWKKDKRPWIYLVRNTVEISEALIDSIQDTIINKFSDDNVTFEYTRGSFKDGIVDVKINDELFIRIVSLNIQLRRIKLAVLKNIKAVLMDEYIIDPKTKEKYLTNEAFKIKEAYTTWRRECSGILKVYFLANPYSLFNPLFIDWGVNVNKLRKGEFYVGDQFIIHWAIMSKELREHLLQVNPLYQFDEDYSGYALEGSAINDANIKVAKLQDGFFMRFVFKIQDFYIGVFETDDYLNNEFWYHAKEVDEVSSRRMIYCFDLEELVERSQVMDSRDKLRVSAFKNAIRRGRVSFDNINIYYLIKEVYELI